MINKEELELKLAEHTDDIIKIMRQEHISYISQIDNRINFAIENLTNASTPKEADKKLFWVTNIAANLNFNKVNRAKKLYDKILKDLS